MASAQSFESPLPGLLSWQAYEPAVKCDLSSVAVSSSMGWWWVDPIGLEPTPLEAVFAAQNALPAGIFLTNGNHGRSAGLFREKFGIPIVASSEAARELAGEVWVDRTVSAGDKMGEGVQVVGIPGAGPGELALLVAREAGALLCIGDALIHLEPRGLEVLPEKYCCDSVALRGSLEKLLWIEFEAMTFSHGRPLTVDAHGRLKALLSSTS